MSSRDVRIVCPRPCCLLFIQEAVAAKLLPQLLSYRNRPGGIYLKLAGVPGVARNDQWRNRIAMLCII